MKITKLKEDTICNELFGCGAKIERSEFRDIISLQEYRTSGLCQNCQDIALLKEIFGEHK